MRVAKVLIYDSASNVLLLRRSDTHPRYAYEPDLPGGIIEKGETFEDGLAREIKEEVGIDIAGDQLMLVTERAGIGRTTKRLYEVHLPDHPRVLISWEHDRFDWVPIVDLSARLESKDSFIQFVQASL